ncbi:MAG: FtsX-like permease family protein [Lactobacillus sp.]|nr:FtsX-like permease family protein [Lactobacillus sp.]MDN6052749.1 FtsX-like permease family protein [Lactobacillus sp.]
MLLQLALTGLQRRFKDYLVLFSGLIVASMVFYMFLSLAVNPSFYRHNMTIGAAFLPFIFGFGMVILGVITFIYLIYANSFLLSMRQHDYGMFLVLGAKRGRISLLVILETVVTGLLATCSGIVLGFGFTGLVGKLLIGQLDLEIHHFQAFVPQAVLWTFVFFVAVFCFAALWNVQKLFQIRLLELLQEKQKPVKIDHHPLLQALEAVMGLVLLAIAYVAMARINPSMLMICFFTGFFGVLLGSYFLFHSFFSVLITALLKRRSFTYRRLRVFTLGQLKFRLPAYTQILTMTSVLFALALGAITVGGRFHSMQREFSKSSYYAVLVTQHEPATKRQLAKLHDPVMPIYHYKMTAKGRYLNQAEFRRQPLRGIRFLPKNSQYQAYTYPLREVTRLSGQPGFLLSQLVHSTGTTKMLSNKRYARLRSKERWFQLIHVPDLVKDYQTIKRLARLEVQAQPASKDILTQLGLTSYQAGLALTSGFQFMGLFLGIAFLTMLASTLMFKVLSAASDDRPRYRMLIKMGTHEQLLRRSIHIELACLFILPAVLGMIDVLVGLNMFTSLITHPWQGIWFPFFLFTILYTGYYVLTVKLYERSVLN